MPSQRPPGWVRKVVKSSVKTPAKAARPSPSPPARRRDRPPDLPAPARDAQRDEEERAHHEDRDERRLLGREATRASSAPIIAGWYFRGRSRKRQIATISAERDRGDVDVLAGEAREVQVARAEREQRRRRRTPRRARAAAAGASRVGIIARPISTGARRAVKFVSPNSTYISAVR